MSQERNALCSCGSGKKYKKCHLLVEREDARLAEIEWREQMKQRAEKARIKREQLNSYLSAAPGQTSTNALGAVGMLLSASMLAKRYRLLNR